MEIQFLTFKELKLLIKSSKKAHISAFFRGTHFSRRIADKLAVKVIFNVQLIPAQRLKNVAICFENSRSVRQTGIYFFTVKLYSALRHISAQWVHK